MLITATTGKCSNNVNLAVIRLLQYYTGDITFFRPPRVLHTSYHMLFINLQTHNTHNAHNDRAINQWIR